ncbi:MAG: helix-turn-helix transcriptional regulator [Clostridia bacterium]|nr:helix-turn-helix transcriptional regulator [Clostridia bacterium]
MTYYQRLRDLREDRDLKQIDVANVLKIEQTQYSRYERGVQMMGIDKYIVLARFYNVSLDFLTGLISTPEPLDRRK